jgi:predicted nucleic acid-binding protein
MTYLLDTCLISELVAKQPNQKVLDWLDAQSPETLYLGIAEKAIRRQVQGKDKKQTS